MISHVSFVIPAPEDTIFVTEPKIEPGSPVRFDNRVVGEVIRVEVISDGAGLKVYVHLTEEFAVEGIWDTPPQGVSVEYESGGSQ